MGLWLGEENLRVPAKDYTTLTTTTDVKFNPWSQDLPIAGTDGMQFAPELDSNNNIYAFVSDVSRICIFNYANDSS